MPVTKLGGSLAISSGVNKVFLPAILNTKPKVNPTPTPTKVPTKAPTAVPTKVPTKAPTAVPTVAPTLPSGGQPSGPAKAFPGAEGFGADAIGGRGGKVIEVTNLNDSGTGSFRACAIASGPRICVFKVGGTINLNSAIMITNPYLTIAGQTAPGDGILMRNAPGASTYTPLNIRTHDVIVRYITVRAGPTSGAGDAMSVNNLDFRGVYNIVIDHSSFSWGVDEAFSTWRDVHDLSLQWSIFSEGLDCSTHSKGCHSKSLMLGSGSGDAAGTKLGAYNMSVHHNLIANSNARNPLVKTSGVIDLVNNVSYNARGTFSMIDMESKSVTPVNYVNNYFKGGPNTPSGTYGTRVDDSKGGYGVSLYVKGNISPSRTSESQPDTNFVDPRSNKYLTTNRHAADPVTTTSASEAFNQVVGASGNSRGINAQGQWFARRDAVDQRVTAEVKGGTGKVIDAPASSSCPPSSRYPGHACIYLTAADYTRHGITSKIASDGWPVINGSTGYADADHDGMSDEWERMYGFDPNNAADGSRDKDSDGYTNVEEFLNGTAP